MTNKEAIQIIRGVRNSFQEDCLDEYEALDLAIKALENQESVEEVYKKGYEDAKSDILSVIDEKDLFSSYIVQLLIIEINKLGRKEGAQ